MPRGYKKTTSDFILEVEGLVGNDFEVVGEYVRYDIPITLRCSTCSEIFEMKPGTFRDNPKCPICFPRKGGNWARKTVEVVQGELDDMSPGFYKVTGDYRNRVTEVQVLHTLCGKEFLTTPKSIRYATFRCPNCPGSSGEQLVENALVECGVEYVREYSIPETPDQKRYDFYLPQYKALIEYDGLQHFEELGIWGGKENLEFNKANDEQKSEDALVNGYQIMRIREGYKHCIFSSVVNHVKRLEEKLVGIK